MDNGWRSRLVAEAERLGVALDRVAAAALERLADELLRWNARVNLTAITRSDEVLEKHFLDSLAVAPVLGGVKRLLDLGSGPGFPGLPLRIALPQLEVELVESVGKKVGFAKQMIATLGLFPGARATQARAEGKPDSERIARADAVVSRALMDVGPWLTLAAPYLLEGGRVVAMMANAEESLLQEQAALTGLRLAEVRRFSLPSGDPRAVAVFFKQE